MSTTSCSVEFTRFTGNQRDEWEAEVDQLCEPFVQLGVYPERVSPALALAMWGNTEEDRELGDYLVRYEAEDIEHCETREQFISDLYEKTEHWLEKVQ